MPSDASARRIRPRGPTPRAAQLHAQQQTRPAFDPALRAKKLIAPLSRAAIAAEDPDQKITELSSTEVSVFQFQHEADSYLITNNAIDTIASQAHRPVRPRDIARLLDVTPAHLSHEIAKVAEAFTPR